jgi:hypothetical protein
MAYLLIQASGSFTGSLAERDAGAVDDRRPFGLFAVDDRGVLLGRGRFGLAAFHGAPEAATAS